MVASADAALERREGESAQDWWRRARRSYAQEMAQRNWEQARAVGEVMRRATAAAWDEARGFARVDEGDAAVP